jgi:hypothetical protein
MDAHACKIEAEHAVDAQVRLEAFSSAPASPPGGQRRGEPHNLGFAANSSAPVSSRGSRGGAGVRFGGGGGGGGGWPGAGGEDDMGAGGGDRMWEGERGRGGAMAGVLESQPQRVLEGGVGGERVGPRTPVMASKSMRQRPGIGDREREREREGMDNDLSVRSRGMAEGDGPAHVQNVPATHLGVAPQPVKQMAKEARAASGGISEREKEMMERLRVLEESLGSLGEKTLNASGLEVSFCAPCACLFSHVFHMRLCECAVCECVRV